MLNVCVRSLARPRLQAFTVPFFSEEDTFFLSAAVKFRSRISMVVAQLGTKLSLRCGAVRCGAVD